MRAGLQLACGLLLAATAGDVLAWTDESTQPPAAAAAAAATEADATTPAAPAADAAAPASAAEPAPTPAAAALPEGTRSGLEIYRDFRDGLADARCDENPGKPRWRKHFANAPQRLATKGDDSLRLFGYVVDAMREADLPTEFALIPFVESGYRPGARSGAGPAGLWQFIALTARDHGVPMLPGYDGRLSPIDSTRAAVRYLKTLHGMFAGDWRLAVMAYNAGQYRVLHSLRSAGQVARDAHPEKLPGLSPITHAYVQKLHALSCLMAAAADHDQWQRGMDRPVPVMVAITLPAGAHRLDAWARSRGLDPVALRRINPAFSGGRLGRHARAVQVLVPAPALQPVPVAAGAANTVAPVVDSGTIEAPVADAAIVPRTHVVRRGESAWTIAHRYDVRVAELLARNGLSPPAVLQPGMELKIDDDAPAATGSP